MEFKLEIIKNDNRHLIELPDQFVNDMDLANCDELVGKINARGQLVLSRPLGAGDMCQVCHKKPHKNNICINCGKATCSGCFWELGALCHECLGKGIKHK